MHCSLSLSLSLSRYNFETGKAAFQQYGQLLTAYMQAQQDTGTGVAVGSGGAAAGRAKFSELVGELFKYFFFFSFLSFLSFHFPLPSSFFFSYCFSCDIWLFGVLIFPIRMILPSPRKTRKRLRLHAVGWMREVHHASKPFYAPSGKPNLHRKGLPGCRFYLQKVLQR